MHFHRLLIVAALVWALAIAALPLRADALDQASNPTIDFVPTELAGMQMQLPRGWQQQLDDHSLILVESPEVERSAVLALFALAVQPGTAIAPEELADAVLEQLDLAGHGIRAQLVEQSERGTALYRMHLLETEDSFGYMSSYSFADAASGALVHMFFSAPEARYLELGGPILPLVVFGGMEPQLLARARAEAAESKVDLAGCGLADLSACGGIDALGAGAGPYIDACGRSWSQALTGSQQAAAEADCLQSIEIASRISRMSHETSMKVLYNADAGWCYRGEAGCD